MSNLFIQTLQVQSYGCIVDATFKLSPLHALIGPNDSGKSTILRALRTILQFAASSFGGEPGDMRPFDPMIDWRKDEAKPRFSVKFADGLTYTLETRPNGVVESLSVSGGTPRESGAPRGYNLPGLLHQLNEDSGTGSAAARRLAKHLRVARLLRLDPDSLRAPSPLLLEGSALAFIDERGQGLPAVLDALINRRFDAFTEIQADVRRLFPTISQIGLRNVAGPKGQPQSVWKALEATLVNGRRVPSTALSEGLLYYLAYTAVQYLEPASVLLVEEPENGLHPSRIADVMRILRELSKSTQVVVATHSPLVINELHGNEVSVVTRTPEDGTRATLLSDVPGFDDASKVYQPGEFWVSYADGKMEAPLLQGRPRA